MSAFINRVGLKYGRLLVVKRGPQKQVGNNRGKIVTWECVCECGKHINVQANNLASGNTNSCGCFKIENTKNQNTKHGMTETRIFGTWSDIIKRCTNPKDKFFHIYGGRGIKVCERWLNSFENFYADMGEKPTPKHSIDRIDSNGDYSPENCRWATATEQVRNRSNTLKIPWFDGMIPLSSACEILGLEYSKAYHQVSKYGVGKIWSM